MSQNHTFGLCPNIRYVDDRVRAIAMAMGLVPIMWTRTPEGVSFDTFGTLIEKPLLSSTDMTNRLENWWWGSYGRAILPTV